MSDRPGQPSEGEFGLKLKRKKTCRVAYTLNNTQPVASTIIGDQPLFYMDFQENFEDDAAFYEGEDYGPLETEIAALEKEIKALEKFSAAFVDDGQKRFQDLLKNSAEVTAQNAEKDSDHSFLVSRIKKVLSDSRLAQAYLDFADSHGVTIEPSRQIENSYYDRQGGKILLNPRSDFSTQILLTIKELRTHWQHRSGALINPLLFHPDSAILVNRAQTADIAVSIIRAAWELQLSGHKDVWERIETSPMSDLGHAFAREAFLDFRTINNGVACAAVFEAWFLSERCQAQDKALIQKMLADQQGYVFDLNSISVGLTPELIGALGSMPFGKNYLAVHATTILEDPIFTDVRDRSSSNFLWFIKFERSFRETERHLQNHPDHATGSAFGAANRKTQDDHNGQSTAQVIKLDTKLHAEKKGSKPSDKILSDTNHQQQGRGAGDNIVYLGRWSAE